MTEQRAPVESVERDERTVSPPPSPVTSSEPAEAQTLPGGLQELAAPQVKKDRRVLRAVLRWTAAVVVFGVVGASAAYGVSRMERTDVPGLATESDGRWDYPTITRPPLPVGRPAPFAEVNKAGAHYADLRRLLLPVPRGAKADAALRGKDGWLEKKTFLAEYAVKKDQTKIRQLLTDYGLRHTAARGWTTPDGTHTRIYLLQFNTAVVSEELVARELTTYGSPVYPLRGATVAERDDDFPGDAALENATSFTYTESKPYGAEQVRHAYITAGDTIGLVVQSRKGTADAIPFQQTVTLECQLLD